MVLVIGVGWALYVLPAPGPLSPGELAVAMFPALAILLALIALLAAGAVLLWGVRLMIRLARRR
jgi:hypothetical protein